MEMKNIIPHNTFNILQQKKKIIRMTFKFQNRKTTKNTKKKIYKNYNKCPYIFSPPYNIRSTNNTSSTA